MGLTLTNNHIEVQYDRKSLLEEILGQFQIHSDGYHGVSHWARVRHHALKVGALVGADLLVVELFSYLHDSRRQDEDADQGHGERAADYAFSLNGKYFDLKASRLDNLCEAIRHHSGGQIHKDPTIQTCWDADRLDIGRVGIKPSARFLSTHAAAFIEEAFDWSRKKERASLT